MHEVVNTGPVLDFWLQLYVSRPQKQFQTLQCSSTWSRARSSSWPCNAVPREPAPGHTTLTDRYWTDQPMEKVLALYSSDTTQTFTNKRMQGSGCPEKNIFCIICTILPTAKAATTMDWSIGMRNNKNGRVSHKLFSNKFVRAVLIIKLHRHIVLQWPQPAWHRSAAPEKTPT